MATITNKSKRELFKGKGVSLVQLLKPSIYLSGFNCGKNFEGINSYITDDLPDLAESRNIAVYALIQESTNIVIGLSCIRCNAMGDKALKKAELTVPCIELVIFAVDKKFRKKRFDVLQTYGEYLMSCTLELLGGLMECVGASFVLLKAADQCSGKLIEFYT